MFLSQYQRSLWNTTGQMINGVVDNEWETKTEYSADVIQNEDEIIPKTKMSHYYVAYACITDNKCWSGQKSWKKTKSKYIGNIYWHQDPGSNDCVVRWWQAKIDGFGTR